MSGYLLDFSRQVAEDEFQLKSIIVRDVANKKKRKEKNHGFCSKSKFENNLREIRSVENDKRAYSLFMKTHGRFSRVFYFARLA